ncbi:hypothetical protein [uncultured Brachyspira sp.]|uniref:hypothetical protein n=1 Tax=uncultured Brachyspira sp. TaxID=221953 RepID=UPI0025EA4249|nr:hypothetical protein [uncultured Brachyspira sp.]
MSRYILPEEDLSRASDWISNFFIREGYHADYTIESLFEVDKFFKEKLYMVLENDNNRNFIFSISAYIGEVIKNHFNGHWEVSHDIDLDDETIGICFFNHETVYPLNITLELIQKKYTLKEYLNNNFELKD